jgi:hypothetical protein
MTLRVNHEFPNTPEEIRVGSVEELTERLLRPIDGEPQLLLLTSSPVGYIREGDKSSTDDIIDLRPLRQQMSEIELELQENQRFHTPVRLFRGHLLKKQIAELREADLIPDGALPLYIAYYKPPYQYGTWGYGPQISDALSATLSLSIQRECFAFKDQDGQLVAVDGSYVTNYWSYETYQDENEKITNKTLHETLTSQELHAADNPELLSVLKYFAGLRNHSDKNEAR